MPFVIPKVFYFNVRPSLYIFTFFEGCNFRHVAIKCTIKDVKENKIILAIELMSTLVERNQWMKRQMNCTTLRTDLIYF